jgi:hypothetical protein
MRLQLEDAAGRDTFLLELLHQQAPRLVVANDAHWLYRHAKVGKVHHGVAAAPGYHLPFSMLQDEHRRLPRYPRNLAIDELIRHQVAQHRYSDILERLYDSV